MRTVIAALAMSVMLALAASAAVMDDVVLPLSHPLQPGEQLAVAVSVGAIGHQRIEVTTAQGQRVGTISPFGVQAGRAGGTYLLPVPPDAVRDGGVELHLTITSGDQRRSPTTEEVTGIRLVRTGG